MTRATILVTDPIGSDTSVFRQAAEAAGVALLVGDAAGWQQHVPQADAIIANLAPLDAGTLARAARCRIVARLGVGVDSVDVAAATARRIWVTNVPRYCTDEVAEHAIALILALQRRLRPAQADLERGQWNQLAYRGIQRARETTLGIIGLGQLGRATARRAAALGFRLLGHDPAPADADPGIAMRLCGFDEVLAAADIVSLHLPLVPETRNLIDAGRIARMKPGAFLVNVSRGGLVDEAALLAALAAGHLGGAALDAFEREPLPAASPLHRHPNLILTPHIAFLSEQSLVSLQRQAVEDVLRVLSGRQPLNPVNSPGGGAPR